MADPVNTLAIVGASARAAVFSAVRAGFEVIAADLFADADLARVVDVTRIDDYPSGLTQWLRDVDCGGWLYTGALENYPAQIDLMRALQPLLGNDGEALDNVRDPLALERAAAEAGLSFPETRSNAAGLPLDGSWLCKTYRGSSGTDVWRLDGANALERAERKQAFFQRYVAGESAAAVFVAASDGARVLGVTRQWVGGHDEHEWRYSGSIGPILVSENIARQLAPIGDLLARRFGLRGLAGVDLILADDRAWIVEVNPRYTASVEILERASGLSAVAAHVAACDPEHWGSSGETPTPRVLNLATTVHAKTILFAHREIHVSSAFTRWAHGRSGLDVNAAWLADIPHPGEAVPVGRPVLTVFAAAPSITACEAELRQRVAEVQSRLYHQ